jgi:hypothetical protein
MCEKPPTSTEHIPPQCIFPEKKDLPVGVDFRKNLITVPSCDDHNISKSDNDEYLNLVIMSHFENNLHAQRQFSKKQMRAFTKRSSKFSMFKGMFPAKVFGLPSMGFKADRERLDKSLDWIARGLYYHQFADVWNEKIKVVIPSLFAVGSNDSKDINLREAHVAAITSRYLKDEPMNGENPEIFHYQLRREINPLGLMVRMVFYEGFVSTAFSIPSIMNVENDA